MTGAEEWRPAPGFEGWYEVSDLGRVRRIAAAPGTRVGRVRKPVLSRGGYLRLLLKNPGIRSVSVHQLVALAFLEPCPPGHEVNHKDCDKTNNRAVNLEWVTRSQNTIHGLQNGRGLGKRVKLTPEQAREIRTLRGQQPKTEVAQRFGVCLASIANIWAGRTWGYLEEAPP